MAFVGPHHGPKILGKNHQSTTKVTLNEPPIMPIWHFKLISKKNGIGHGTIGVVNELRFKYSCVCI